MSIEIEQIDKRLTSVEAALTQVQQKLRLVPTAGNWVDLVSGSLADIPDDDYQKFLECCRAVRAGDAVEESAP